MLWGGGGIGVGGGKKGVCGVDGGGSFGGGWMDALGAV